MRVCFALALLLLAGCDKIPTAKTDAQIRAIAAEEVKSANGVLEVRMIGLQQENERLQRDVKLLRDWLKEDTENLEHLRRTFNGNVQKDNEAAVARMTARGACGTEQVTFPGGGYTLRNKECTLKDLR